MNTKPNLIPVASKNSTPTEAEVAAAWQEIRVMQTRLAHLEASAAEKDEQLRTVLARQDEAIKNTDRKSQAHGRQEGRWQGMIMGAALVLGLMAFGYTAVTFNTAVAVRQGAAIAGAEAANNEIRQELDNR